MDLFQLPIKKRVKVGFLEVGACHFILMQNHNTGISSFFLKVTDLFDDHKSNAII